MPETESHLSADHEGWLIVRERDERYELRAKVERGEPVAMFWRGRTDATMLEDFVFEDVASGEPVSVIASSWEKRVELKEIHDKHELAAGLLENNVNPTEVLFFRFETAGAETEMNTTSGMVIWSRVDLKALEPSVDDAPDDMGVSLSLRSLRSRADEIAEFIHRTNRFPVKIETARKSLATLSEALAPDGALSKPARNRP